MHWFVSRNRIQGSSQLGTCQEGGLAGLIGRAVLSVFDSNTGALIPQRPLFPPQSAKPRRLGGTLEAYHLLKTWPRHLWPPGSGRTKAFYPAFYCPSGITVLLGVGSIAYGCASWVRTYSKLVLCKPSKQRSTHLALSTTADQLSPRVIHPAPWLSLPDDNHI